MSGLSQAELFNLACVSTHVELSLLNLLRQQVNILVSKFNQLKCSGKIHFT